MSSDTEMLAALKQAEEKEKNYKWLEAAKLYEQVLCSQMRTASVAESHFLSTCLNATSNLRIMSV